MPVQAPGSIGATVQHHRPAGLSWLHALARPRPAVVLALGSAAYLASGLVAPPVLLDEGLVTVGAQRILSGEVPYRDFWLLYAPGQFYLLALVFKLFGLSLLPARLLHLAIQVGLILAVFAVSRRLIDGRTALVPPILTTLWLGSVTFPNYPMFPALLLTLAAVDLFCRFQTDGRRWWLLLAGASVGLAAVFRHDVGVYAIASFGLVLVLSAPGWLAWRATGLRRPVAASLGRLGLLLGGCLLVTTPVMAFLLATVPLRDLWADLYVYPVQIAPLVRGQQSPTFLPDLGDSLAGRLVVGALVAGQWVQFLAPVAVYALCGVGAALFLLRGPRSRAIRAEHWSLLLLSLLGVALLGQVRIIRDWIHLLPTTIVAVILLGAALQRMIPATQPAWLRWAGPVLFAVVAGPYVVGPTLGGVITSVTTARAAWTHGCPMTLDTAGCATVQPDLAEAVDYVRQHVPAGQPIFVGSTRNDKTWGNPIVFYFLADRPSATRYHQFEPGIATTAEAQTEMIADFERKRVSHVVLFSGFDTHGAGFTAGSALLDEYISAHYRPAATFGDYTIWNAALTPAPAP